MTTQKPPGSDPTVDVAIYRYSVDFNTPKPRMKIKTLINNKNTAGNLNDTHTTIPVKIQKPLSTINIAYVHSSYIHTKIISRNLISNIRWYAEDPGYYQGSTSEPSCTGNCSTTDDCSNGCVCVDGKCKNVRRRVLFNAILAGEYYTEWDTKDSVVNQPLTSHPNKIGEVIGKLGFPYQNWEGNPFIYNETDPFLINFGNTRETIFMVLQFSIYVRDVVGSESVTCPKINCVWIYDDPLEF